MEEIKETIVQVLDQQGILATLKAQLRACVFAVVEEQEGKSYATELEERAKNPRKAKLLGQHDGRLLAVLIREFLEWSHMNYALKVYEAESGVQTDALQKDSLRNDLGLDHVADEPLLLSVLRAHMTHADHTAKLSTKGKSSITAKPGGHIVNIPAPNMQAHLKDPSEGIKAIHHTSPESVPEAAVVAAAMHATPYHAPNLHQHDASATAPHTRTGLNDQLLGASQSHTAPSSSHLAPPGETPQVSPRHQLNSNTASQTRAQAYQVPSSSQMASTSSPNLVSTSIAASASTAALPVHKQANTSSSSLASGAAAAAPRAMHSSEVPLIRQVSTGTSSSSAQSPSTASVISEDIEFEIDDQLQAAYPDHLQSTAASAQPEASPAAAAVPLSPLGAASDADTAHSDRLSGMLTSPQQLQQPGVQSPALTSPMLSPASDLSLPLPKDPLSAGLLPKTTDGPANADTPKPLNIPTEINRKAFPDSPSGLISPGDNSTEYDPESLSASRESSPSRHALTAEPSAQSSSSSPGLKSIDASPMPSPAAYSKPLPDPSPSRSSARLPPLAPLQAKLGLGSPNRKSAEQIRQELREQDAWFDDTDESDGVDSPLRASPQKWKVHAGLGAAASPSHGYVNAAFDED